jgi:DNA-binding MarR family transcriptional regulator
MTGTECNCAALRQATRFVTRVYDEALAATGLGINQYSVLARLERAGPLMLNDLARTLVMDRSTVGHLLRPLAARDLVSLATDPADARCRTVSLTDAGRALLAEARPLWSAAQARFEAGFGAGKAEALRAALADLVAAPIHPPAARTPLPPITTSGPVS